MFQPKLLYNYTRPTRMYKKLLIGIVGIYGAYLTMSVLSESIYNTEFTSSNPNLQKGKFSYPFLFIWFGALLCSLYGFGYSVIKKEKQNPISIKERIILGILYTINITTTNFALLYISYPLQVVGRNCRFLFVVIVGAFFSRVKKTTAHHLKLGKHKIIIASVITLGVLLFNFAKESKKDKASRHNPNQEWIGYILLTISVICDALFSDSQAYSKAHFKPTGNQLFTITNFFTFVFCILVSIFIDKSFFPSLQFLWNYPQAMYQIIGIGILQVVGQVSIYYVITHFKQHIFPLISTTRKIITVLLSIFIFGHHINSWQWVSIFIVFFGMFYELYEEISRGDKNQLKKNETEKGVWQQQDEATVLVEGKSVKDKHDG